MFLSLYTDKAKGILTEQRFMKLTATLEQEHEANQKRLQDLMLMMRHSDEQETGICTGTGSFSTTDSEPFHSSAERGRKKICSIEANMRGIPRFAEWLESTNLTATLTLNMEKQTKQADQQEITVQWREEYRTRWHDHIKGVRVGMWIVIAWFAAGVITPIPLYLSGVKFTTVMKTGAVTPVPFLFFCLLFAPVLLFSDRPQNATPEWRSMHIHVLLIPCLLIGFVYFWQASDIWGDWVLQEADRDFGWLLRVLSIVALLIVLQILRSPKRMRVAGLFMGILGLSIACGLHYCVNAALIGQRCTIRLLLWTTTQMTRMCMMMITS